jgi:hypothetical protein
MMSVDHLPVAGPGRPWPGSRLGSRRSVARFDRSRRAARGGIRPDLRRRIALITPVARHHYSSTRISGRPIPDTKSRDLVLSSTTIQTRT